MTGPAPSVTEDRFCRGRLLCRQYVDGYRFSVDAVLAARYCRITGRETVLDLGCGCGIIGMILVLDHPRIQIVGLEMQPGLARLARENMQCNGFTGQSRVIQGDARHIGRFLEPESCDLVVCNPPYRPLGTGRVNLSSEAAMARHEVAGNLGDMVAAAAFAVRNRSPVVMVYPASRMAVLLASMEKKRLIPKRIRPVYSYPGIEAATLVLVEAVKNGGTGCMLEAPLYIYECKNGPFSDEMNGFYGSGPCPDPEGN